MIVTDDYVVLADDLRGNREHTFDNLLHLRGASLADPGTAQFLRHDSQFNTDSLGSGQFITNVNRYAVTAPVLVHSIHRFGANPNQGMTWSGDSRNWETGGASSISEPGVLQIDEHVLWPQRPEIVIGDYPENWPVSKKLEYEVLGDTNALTSGTFGAWILGKHDIDVDVTNVKTLQLFTKTSRGGYTRNTIFWGNPIVVTNEGKEIPLARLKMASANIIPTARPDRDYEGGPVHIAGDPFDQSLPAEPRDTHTPGVITIDLSGVNAVRFKATVGGDWPVGDEEQLRKVVSVESRGSSAQFLTLIEPFQDKPMVKSASATSPGTLSVVLTGGRTQQISIDNFEGSGAGIEVSITEMKDGKTIRKESVTR